LWHRNTSKISALESCPFTQRQFYRGNERRRQINFARIRTSTSSRIGHRDIEPKRPVPDHEVFGLIKEFFELFGDYREFRFAHRR
jgi:hypothetical protein